MCIEKALGGRIQIVNCWQGDKENVKLHRYVVSNLIKHTQKRTKELMGRRSLEGKILGDVYLLLYKIFSLFFFTFSTMAIITCLL